MKPPEQQQDTGFYTPPSSRPLTEPRKPAGIHKSRYETDPTHVVTIFLRDVEGIKIPPTEVQRDSFRERDSLRRRFHELEETDGAEKEISCLETIKRDIGDLENDLIVYNLPLVVAVAKKFYLREGEILSPDLLQEGFFGLKKAVEDFDVERGNEFSTYAYPKIRQAISRAVDNTANTIRLPIWLSDAVKRIRKTQKHLEEVLGREPTLEEISRILPDLSPKRISSLLMHKTTSNVDMMDREENPHEGPFFGTHHHNGHGSLRPVEKIFIEAEEAELPNLVPIITPEEQKVLALFFGKNLTLKEIGLIIEKSLSTAERRYYTALKKLCDCKERQVLSASATLFDFQESSTDVC